MFYFWVHRLDDDTAAEPLEGKSVIISNLFLCMHAGSLKKRITAALDIISLVCDRQQKEMQNAMRKNKDSISVIINDFLPCIAIFYRVQMLSVKLLSYSSTVLLIKYQ